MPDCVYCGAPADGREHWLPRAFGTFGDLQVLHGRICTGCNNALGRELDEELTRTGPEALYRIHLGIGGRHDGQANPFYYRAVTGAPIRATSVNGTAQDPALMWEIVPPAGPGEEPQGRALQQLVVEDASGRRHFVPFNPDWNEAALRLALENRRIVGGSLQQIYLDKEHLQRVGSLLTAVFGKFSADHFTRTGAGGGRQTLEFAHKVGVAYFRAIAKVAFHGAMRLLPALDGGAWEFDVIRRFIRWGEKPTTNPVEFWNEPIFVGPNGETRFRCWGHLVAVKVDHRDVSAFLQFFVGPRATPQVWKVRLGRKPESFPGGHLIGYYYRYLDELAADGHTGEMLELA